MAYQMDLLLLETGFLTVFYAPWLSLSVPRTASRWGHPISWLLRAKYFKFMVCMGTSKVINGGPPWKELTALEYYFASSSLPTGEAWYFHSLPPFLLRLGTASAIVMQLLLSWLVIAPITPVRRIAVVGHLIFHLIIALTGNYGWFSLQCLILLLPIWAADAPWRSSGGPCSCLLKVWSMWERCWGSCLGILIGILIELVWITDHSSKLFSVTTNWRAIGKSPPGAFLGSTWLGNFFGFFTHADALLSSPGALAIESQADEFYAEAVMEWAVRSSALCLYLYIMASLSAIAYVFGGDPAPPGGLTSAIMPAKEVSLVASAELKAARKSKVVREFLAMRQQLDAMRDQNRELKLQTGGELSADEDEETMAMFLEKLRAVLRMRNEGQFDQELFDDYNGAMVQLSDAHLKELYTGFMAIYVGDADPAILERMGVEETTESTIGFAEVMTIKIGEILDQPRHVRIQTYQTKRKSGGMNDVAMV